MKIIRKAAFLAVIFALSLSGCFFQSGLSDEDIAKIASSASDYRDLTILASMGKLEKDDLEEKGGGPMTLFTDEWTITLPDGTIVTVVRVLDDKDTPEDTEDDVITVTRTYDIWNGEAEKIEKIVRPAKPEYDWTSWEENRIIQEGTTSIFIDGVELEKGTIVATWKRDGEDVSLDRIEKETYRIDRAGVIVRLVITFDDDGLQTKIMYRVKLTQDGEVIVHSFTFEEFEENGVVYTRIIRDDGSYAIVRSPRDPRITEYYTADDILRARVTETRLGKTLYVTKEFYDSSGNLVDTKNVTIQYQFLGDEVIITKTFDDGSSITISIQEDDEGFIVNRNGFIYIVRFISGGIEIYDENMNIIATVMFNEDGSWTITYPDGSQEVVA